MSQDPEKSTLFTPGVKAVLGFTLAYIAAAIAGALATGNGEFIIYVGIMAMLIGVVGLVHSRVTLTLVTLWALTAWGAAHMAGGLIYRHEKNIGHGFTRMNTD